MFIHRPTFIYNVLSPLSARQDGFHWRTWWKTPVSLFSHLFRIFHHPFQCLHACLPYLIFDDGLHKIGKSVWTKGVISLIVGLRYRILELNQPMKILNIEPTHENIEYWANPWKGNFQWGPQCRRGWRQREAFRAGGRGSHQAPMRSFASASMCHLYKLYNATSIKVLSSQLWD